VFAKSFQLAEVESVIAKCPAGGLYSFAIVQAPIFSICSARAIEFTVDDVNEKIGLE
jgi:hypothetical protein